MLSIRAALALALAGSVVACGVLLGAKDDPSVAPASDAGDSAVGIDALGADACSSSPRSFCETFDLGDAAGSWSESVNDGSVSVVTGDFSTSPPSALRAMTYPTQAANDAFWRRSLEGPTTDVECTFAARVEQRDDTASVATLFRVRGEFAGASPTPDFYVEVGLHFDQLVGRIHTQPDKDNEPAGTGDAYDTYLGAVALPLHQWLRFRLKAHIPPPTGRGDLVIEARALNGDLVAAFDAGADASPPFGTTTGVSVRIGVEQATGNAPTLAYLDDVYCFASP